jgi:hypothetical protein
MNQTVQISSVGSTWENIPKSWLAWLQPVWSCPRLTGHRAMVIELA